MSVYVTWRSMRLCLACSTAQIGSLLPNNYGTHRASGIVKHFDRALAGVATNHTERACVGRIRQNRNCQNIVLKLQKRWITTFACNNMDILQGNFRHCNWLSLRRLVSWINHLPPACWFIFWKSTFKQQLDCRFDIMDCKSSFFCILTYVIAYELIHHMIFRLYLYFSISVVFINVVFILSILYGCTMLSLVLVNVITFQNHILTLV